MKEEFKKLQEILLKLFDSQQHLVHTDKLPEDYYKLFDVFNPIQNQNQIINLMNVKEGTQTDFSNSDYFLYLPPLSQDPKTIPILSMDCDLDESPSNVSFYIVIFRYPDDGGSIPSYLGFRFEGPEGSGDAASRHDYWHVQIIKEFKGRHGQKFPKYHNWLPVKMPCIPIKAECPVSLLICLLFSFYGNQLFADINFSLRGDHTRPLDGILRIRR